MYDKLTHLTDQPLVKSLQFFFHDYDKKEEEMRDEKYISSRDRIVPKQSAIGSS